METRALNVCWSGPLLEHVEDSEEDETPVQTGEIEYEQGDRLFMARVLPEPTAEDVRGPLICDSGARSSPPERSCSRSNITT